VTTLDDLLYPEAREPQRQIRPLEQGTVVSVDVKGVKFTLDSFPSTVGFGPAPYGIWTAETSLTGPQPGQKCLVAFATHDISDPWVIAWSQ
jgi:hypothetical protein